VTHRRGGGAAAAHRRKLAAKVQRGSVSFMPTIYRKTARGLAEIETRVYKLPPRLRSVLIMIDGRRTDTEVVQLMPQAAEALATLVQEDFIAEFARAGSTPGAVAAPPVAPSAPATVVSAAAPAAARAAPAATTAAPERTVIRGPQPTFDAMRRDLLGAFSERVGAAGEAMVVRLARARNATEFRALLPAAVQLVATLHGREAAEAFTARINAW